MPHRLKGWEAHSALEGLENQELLCSNPYSPSAFYLWAEHFDSSIRWQHSESELLGIVAVIVPHSPVYLCIRPRAEQMPGCLPRSPPVPTAPASAAFQGASCHRLRILPGGMQEQQPAQAHGHRDGERHLESWSGTKGARNSERGELFKEEHQSVRDGERAENDRSGLKSHLSPSSYYVNYSCSLAAAAAEVIADVFWKHLLRALPSQRLVVAGQ